MIVIYRVTGDPPASGRSGKRFKNPMKSHARQCSSGVRGYDCKVGPRCRFFQETRAKGGPCETEEDLDKQEVTFGVKKLPDGTGGFEGLVDWTWKKGRFGVVRLNMDTARAKQAHADGWLEGFVQEIIRVCGWTIIHTKRIDSDEGNSS